MGYTNWHQAKKHSGPSNICHDCLATVRQVITSCAVTGGNASANELERQAQPGLVTRSALSPRLPETLPSWFPDEELSGATGILQIATHVIVGMLVL